MGGASLPHLGQDSSFAEKWSADKTSSYSHVQPQEETATTPGEKYCSSERDLSSCSNLLILLHLVPESIEKKTYQAGEVPQEPHIRQTAPRTALGCKQSAATSPLAHLATGGPAPQQTQRKISCLLALNFLGESRSPTKYSF